MSLANVKLHLIDSVDDAAELMRWLSTRTRIAVDTETTGLDPERDHVRLVQVGDAHHGWTIPWDRWGGVFEEIVQKYQGEWIAHNMKYDAAMLAIDCDIHLPRHKLDDTRIMAHVLHPERSTALKNLASHYVDRQSAGLSRQLDEALDARSGGWTWATVPVKYGPYWQYAALDAVLTARLDEILRPMMAQDAPNAYDLERGATWAVYEMERRGAHIDREFTVNQLQRFSDYVNKVERWCIDNWGVKPGSNDAVIRRLEQDGIEFGPDAKRTNGGALSLDKEVLAAIDHPLAQAVLNRRQVQKVTSTYLQNFLAMADDNDLLHPRINTLGLKQDENYRGGFGVRTGRMSMDNPNLQNLTRRTDGPSVGNTVRDCITSREEHTLLMIDFDQIEARMFAHMTGDPGLISAFSEGDFFTNVAREIFNDPSITKKDPRRQVSKNATYAKCPHPSTRVLTRDLDWVPIGDLRVGDELLAFDEYLNGHGNDHPRTRTRRWRHTHVLRHRISMQDSVRVHLTDGTTLLCSTDHAWLTNDLHRQLPGWTKTCDLVPGRDHIIRYLYPWKRESSYDAGWLAGIMDGEGHTGPQGRWGISQKGDTIVASRISHILSSFGLEHIRDVRSDNTGVHVWRSIGTIRNNLQTLGRFQPARLISNINLDGTSLWRTSRLGVGIEAIEPAGMQEVVEMETGTHTYFAEGFGSHNCYGAGTQRFALTAGIPLDAAEAFNQRFDQLFPGARSFMNLVQHVARERLSRENLAYVRSPLTNRRYTAEEGREYVLVNYVIQGTAAEVLKLKMLEMASAGLSEFMILPVHDEIILDVPDDQVRDVMMTARGIMNDDTLFRVPLTASPSVGKRWGQKQDVVLGVA